MKHHRYLILLFVALITMTCGTSPRQTSDTPPSHEIWNELLQQHVNEEGWVSYKGFIRDRDKLEQYLDLLSSHAPQKDAWSRNEQLAYWINAYNAFTLKLIIDNYPIKSIRDLGPTISIPGIRTVWHRKFFKIGGRETSLDEIEHEILRKEFNEPRIHFAINCASYSCPPLRDEAFIANRLDQQLTDQAILFINDPDRNRLASDRIEVSKIFRWFGDDFTHTGSLIEYLNRYASIPIEGDADVNFLPYDWTLNEAKE